MEVKTEQLRWQYHPEWCAWWLVQDDGVTSALKHGPFNETEAIWAGARHGVPFARKGAE